MAEQFSLRSRPRAGTGKGEARGLRRLGRVPAVVYGSDIEPVHVSVDARELYHALHTTAGENAVIDMTVDGGSHLAIAREVQVHPYKRHIMHVDFVTVRRGELITVEVPIVLEGDATGASEGGVVTQDLLTLAVEVEPLEVPDQIALDISGMEVGHTLRVQDLTLPEGVRPLEDPDRAIVSVVIPALEVPEPGEQVTLEEGEAYAGEAAEAEGPVGAENARAQDDLNN